MLHLVSYQSYQDSPKSGATSSELSVLSGVPQVEVATSSDLAVLSGVPQVGVPHLVSYQSYQEPPSRGCYI